MHAALWVSKTGLAAQDTQMQVISNNLANVNTVGFKQDRAVFEDLFYQMKKNSRAQWLISKMKHRVVCSWVMVFALSAPKS